jgi:hypothetical protein
MDIFSLVVLEDTLDKLANRPMLPDKHSRLDQCVTVVRACMNLIAHNPSNRHYKDKIHLVLGELAGIARQNGDHISARRLRAIMHELNSSGDIQRRFAQTA